ncbi:26S proteasome non-ATPase regulatory subunit 11 [Mycena vulgaris]|nr:26S proteasome non-ATPase regulatory subunit 11 [Mycena vulgaris]
MSSTSSTPLSFAGLNGANADALVDDKLILTEVHLLVLKSKIYRGVGSVTKAKVRPCSLSFPLRFFTHSHFAALTFACTSGASIYTPPPPQAALDIQSDILHVEEKDYKTAYSYFFEVFEAQASAASFATPKAPATDGAVPKSGTVDVDAEGKGAFEALKYMLLCKIILNLPEDVHSLLSIKPAAKYAQLRDVESMRAIARAHQVRNLADFEKALRDYQEAELSSDPMIRSHLAALYDTLLEQNLLRIVEPYLVVELAHIATCVSQGRGCLLMFDDTEADMTYATAIETLQQVGKVVESVCQDCSDCIGSYN